MTEPRYVEFRPPRPLAGYIGMAGNEANEKVLPAHVLDSRAATVVHGKPDEYLVSGMDIDWKGRRFLRFAINPAHVERNSDVRYFYPEGQAKPPRVPRKDQRGREVEALPEATARPILDTRKPPPLDSEPIPEPKP